MSIALCITIGLAAGLLSLWLDRRWGWKAGFAAAVAFTAVVLAGAAATDLALRQSAAALVASSVPNLVAGAVTGLQRRSAT
ncbi:MAG TPA: hypothetical protein VNJ48_22085 [Nocardioides sp.]|nr:hypothetical protein [Nocardioides sp.]